MASMFSRDKILFPSSTAIQFVHVGLCHLTQSEEPWSDDVYEDESEDSLDESEGLLEENEDESEDPLDESNTETGESNMEKDEDLDDNANEQMELSSSIGSHDDIAIGHEDLWCTLAE